MKRQAVSHGIAAAFFLLVQEVSAIAAEPLYMPTLSVCRKTAFDVKNALVRTQNGDFTIDANGECRPPAFPTLLGARVLFSPRMVFSDTLLLGPGMITSTGPEGSRSPIAYLSGQCFSDINSPPPKGCRYRMTIIINLGDDQKSPDLVVLEIMDGFGNLVWHGGGPIVSASTLNVNGMH